MTMTEPSSLANSARSVHLLHRAGGDVQVVPLTSPVAALALLTASMHVQEAVAPVHEGLRVDVLVVLHEVEAALQPS
jgi:hypothetical protein